MATLARYIQQGKVPAPTILKVGSASLHAWMEEDIERVRKLLPKIANGRKTRYKKKNSGVPPRRTFGSSRRAFGRSQESEEPKAKAKTKKKKKPPPRVAAATSTAVPHKKH